MFIRTPATAHRANLTVFRPIVLLLAALAACGTLLTVLRPIVDSDTAH